MSGFYNEQNIGDSIYANTYSLWGNSKYYDIKNLSPQNFTNRSSTVGSAIGQEFRTRWVPEAEVKKPDYFARRIITRESLYQEPDKNKKIKYENKKLSTAIDWTMGYWEKADWLDETAEQSGTSRAGVKKPVLDGAKMQKKLDEMLSKPVKMSKAESMMQKMGWQGGALGRSGDGIVEPIAPNAVYSSNKVGFGQLQLLKPQPPKPAEKRQHFETNVLHNVYEFVRNNNEIELLFDTKLRRDERKKIHHIVQLKVQADDLTAVDFDNTDQVEIVLQINNNNCYMLHTKSYGSFPNRQLCLFKVAPDHVFLVTPHHLRTTVENDTDDELIEEECTEDVVSEPPVDQKVQKPPEEKKPVDQKVQKLPEEKKPQELEPEETNPFLRSITRNLKKDSESETKEDSVNPEIPENPKVTEAEKIPEEPVVPKMSENMQMIVEYYMEFKAKKKFSQFKFLGPFDRAQTIAINDFMEEAKKYLNKEPCAHAKVFEKVEFEIKEDCTGNTGIFKRPVKNRVKQTQQSESCKNYLL
ncbi:uncharacterized protein LOC118279851 [Spodoptera frugiperda]|uniref:Uncharacterized protein LOC118279851 n=1 Tax=Spodoptera frugiperda TaxID=7108 RepID=A0A9R0F1H0_SPOFR|nr:uncharacterized protein LOC118279851 [Spodoptera frugiperda]